VNATSILLADSSWIFATHGNRLFGETPSVESLVNLRILYGAVTSNGVEPLSSLNVPLIHIGTVTLPERPSWAFCISPVVIAYEPCFTSESIEVNSMILSVPSQGDYSIAVFDGSFSGFLAQEECHPLLRVDSNMTFVEHAFFVGYTTCTPSQQFVPSVHLDASPAAADSRLFAATLERSFASGTVSDSIYLSNSRLLVASLDSSSPDAQSSQSFGVGLWIGIGALGLVPVIGVGAFLMVLFLRRNRTSESIGWERETTESPEWQTQSIDGLVSNVNTLGSDRVLELSII
jgi:hypothetical protein